MAEAEVKAAPRPGGPGAGDFPPVPDVADSLALLTERYGFTVNGAGMRPAFRWVERRREVGVPGRSVRFVTEFHLVVPVLNVHIVHVRSRWVELAEGGEVKDSEWVEFHPWAPYPGSVKDLALGRWSYGEE